jgi:hypothetical protein
MIWTQSKGYKQVAYGVGIAIVVVVIITSGAYYLLSVKKEEAKMWDLKLATFVL